MTALVVRGDARSLPLPSDSVDLIVSSPPYWSLRSYQDGGEHYDGQIGSEESPGVFVDALLDCTREWVRVLKPTGSLFVNLGDKYNAYNGGRGEGTIQRNEIRQSPPRGHGLDVKNIRPKSLIGLPWRYAIGCIDQLGLILRAEIVWSKPNGLPESVTDRVRRSHEQWFHFTLQPRYFSAVDEIREPHQTERLRDASKDQRTYDKSMSGYINSPPNPLGKLPGSVWEVPSEPLTVPAHLGVDHFAAFPTAWPKRLILGWSPSGICTACDEGRRPVTTAEREHVDYSLSERRATERVDATGGAVSGGTMRSTLGHTVSRGITGYACACPDTSAPTRPSVILDPFGGTGTTAAVASALGRIGISVDLSHDYSRLAQWRTTDPATRAKILGLPKPARQLDGQISLYDEDVAS